MLNTHIKVMDKLLMDIQDEIYFSKVVELESKVIYVSYFWDIRIVVDNVKKEVVFIGSEEDYSFRWTARTIQEILIYLNVIIARVESCY